MTGYNTSGDKPVYASCQSEKPFVETTQVLNIRALITEVTNVQSNKTAVSWSPAAETHMDKPCVGKCLLRSNEKPDIKLAGRLDLSIGPVSTD